MEIKDLKNYRVAFSEMDIPQEVEEEISRTSLLILESHLESDSLQRFQSLFAEERERLMKVDLAKIREKGLLNEKLIESRVLSAAFFSTMNKIAGKEKAIEISSEIGEVVGLKATPLIFPEAEDLLEFDDPLYAFKSWFLSVADASKKAGCHLFELVEDTEDEFQLNCTYCIWHEIPKLLGVEDAGLSACEPDDVFLPDYCKKMGINYNRTSTLVKGGQFCDFRFERL